MTDFSLLQCPYILSKMCTESGDESWVTVLTSFDLMLVSEHMADKYYLVFLFREAFICTSLSVYPFLASIFVILFSFNAIPSITQRALVQGIRCSRKRVNVHR